MAKTIFAIPQHSKTSDNNMTIKTLLPIALLSLTLHLNGQADHTDPSMQHDEDTHGHEHHRNEIGIANSPVYFVDEGVFSYGLHVHYIHTLKASKFGIGLGYERIFDDHGHNTIGFVTSYRPIDPLSFIISPGISFEDEEPGKVHFSVHAETAYEFEWKDLHIGPVFEVAYDSEDIHISLGLHVGIGF
jgi:hypothetical protein